MKNVKKNKYVILIIIVSIIILIDQISKMLIINAGEINIISNVLKFNVTENTNAAYGIGDNSTIMYVITNLVILGIIFKFVTSQNEYVDTKLKVFLSLIFAGGLSNVIDRIFRGYVIEFINFKQAVNIPVFNIADICVLIGWISIAAIFAVFTVNEMRENRIKNKIKLEDKNKSDIEYKEKSKNDLNNKNKKEDKEKNEEK